MQLTLALPALFDDRGDQAYLPAPALAQLMTIARVPKRESGGIAGALAAHYGVERQIDWPLAPIRLAALGVEPGNAYWLVADTITVEVGLSTAEIAGIVGDLTRAEADALLATLNAHFASDELAFVAPIPSRFFVRAATATRVSTVAASAALRRPLRALLPQGLDAAAWRCWQSEIEMLLHEHPVNVERERAGRAQVNSLWFSEGGMLAPAPSPPANIVTFGANDIASALAAFTRGQLHSKPADLGAALTVAGPADSIVVAVCGALDSGDVERAWAAPARDALAVGSLDSVKLIAEDDGDAVIWHARRPGLWQRMTGRFAAHDLRALLDAARVAA